MPESFFPIILPDFSFEEIKGFGIKIKIDGKKILIGNKKLMSSEKVKNFDKQELINDSESGTVVHIAIDGEYKGFIVISDEIKDSSKIAIAELNRLGIRKTVMLTGDNKREDTENLIKANLVGVELRETYWEKRKYSKELGADKDKSSYYCYQLSRVKRENHDKMISEMLDKELKNIKNNDLKEKIENQIEKNAELNNIDLDD